MIHNFPANGHGRGGLDPRMLAAMRQQDAAPKIDIATFKYLKCDCGSVKMETEAYNLLKVNPLAPSEWVALNVTHQRCLACKKYPHFENGEWTFKAEAPALNLE